MFHKHEVQGRIYTFKPARTGPTLNPTEVPRIPPHIRSKMVLVLDTVQGVKGYVKVMVITTHKKSPGTYLPISPTPKKKYPLQIRLRNNINLDSSFALTRLPGWGQKYLRVDESFEVPASALENVMDGLGDEVMVGLRKTGGMGALGNWLQGWESAREREKARELSQKEDVAKLTEEVGELGKEAEAEVKEVMVGKVVKEGTFGWLEICKMILRFICWILRAFLRLISRK